jgi:hypothetical protein
LKNCDFRVDGLTSQPQFAQKLPIHLAIHFFHVGGVGNVGIVIKSVFVSSPYSFAKIQVPVLIFLLFTSILFASGLFITSIASSCNAPSTLPLAKYHPASAIAISTAFL